MNITKELVITIVVSILAISTPIIGVVAGRAFSKASSQAKDGAAAREIQKLRKPYSDDVYQYIYLHHGLSRTGLRCVLNTNTENCPKSTP